jgi:hypothetical protein
VTTESTEEQRLQDLAAYYKDEANTLDLIENGEIETAPALAAEPTSEQVAALSVPAIRFQTHCIASWAGIMRKATFTVPFEMFASLFTPDALLQRYDFDLANEATFHGQRAQSEPHIQQMLEDLKISTRPFLGTITLAIDAQEVLLEEKWQQYPNVHWAVLTIPAMASNPLIEDGQHRIEVAKRLRAYAYAQDAIDGPAAELRDLLEQTSVDVTLLLEGEPDVLSSIFVRMGRTKPISADLMVVMDQTSRSNRLARYAIRNCSMLSGRVAWLETAAMKRQAKNKGQHFETLYGAAAVRGAVASVAGVGVRDQNSGDRERIISTLIHDRAREQNITEEQALESIGKEVVALLDYAYGVLPGWREVKARRMSIAKFKQRYVQGTTAGLYVVAGLIAAARMAGVNPRSVIDAAADIEWDRSVLRDAKDIDGKPSKVHVQFENMLVTTRYDSLKGEWAPRPMSTRTGYETAISALLRRLAKQPGLEALGHRSTFVALGLERPKRGPGRPRKEPVVFVSA